eukprot:11163621-Lingulodinium_polyedra.AAC.1
MGARPARQLCVASAVVAANSVLSAAAAEVRAVGCIAESSALAVAASAADAAASLGRVSPS